MQEILRERRTWLTCSVSGQIYYFGEKLYDRSDVVFSGFVNQSKLNQTRN